MPRPGGEHRLSAKLAEQLTLPSGGGYTTRGAPAPPADDEEQTRRGPAWRFSLEWEYSQVTPRCYIFFDVDDTLVEWTVSWADAFVGAAREAGVEVAREASLAALDTAFSTFYDDYVREHAEAGDEMEFWRAYDGRILETLGVRAGLAEATRRVVRVLRDPGARRLYAEVPGALRALSEHGARLGIVSGRPRAGPDLAALGVLDYFAPVIDAFAARSAKTEGRMFHMAAEVAQAAGLPGWHVGDSYDGDVVGARAAGLRPILVDRTGAYPRADCPRVRDLREVLGIVREAEE